MRSGVSVHSKVTVALEVIVVVVVVVAVTFIHVALQNKVRDNSANRCVFSPFLNCPVDRLRCARVTIRECSTVAVLLLSLSTAQVPIVDLSVTSVTSGPF